MRGIIGRKIGMTTVFDGDGVAIPVTVIEAGPCPVVQKKTEEGEGYTALQIGFEEMKTKLRQVKRAGKKVTKNVRPGKPLEGHFKKAGVKPQRHLVELRYGKDAEVADVKVGDAIKCDIFKEADVVDVTGFSKGRGFAGFVKRWNFGGGANTHGSMFHRRAGSVGGSSNPSRIFRGKKMPGHYGDERVTVLNLRVVRVEPEKNVILIRGAVPGANGRIVMIRDAVKAQKAGGPAQPAKKTK